MERGTLWQKDVTGTAFWQRETITAFNTGYMGVIKSEGVWESRITEKDYKRVTWPQQLKDLVHGDVRCCCSGVARELCDIMYLIGHFFSKARLYHSRQLTT